MEILILLDIEEHLNFMLKSLEDFAPLRGCMCSAGFFGTKECGIKYVEYSTEECNNFKKLVSMLLVPGSGLNCNWLNLSHYFFTQFVQIQYISILSWSLSPHCNYYNFENTSLENIVGNKMLLNNNRFWEHVIS